MSEQKIPIPAMLYNAAVGGHVTNSQQVLDETLNREQGDINQEAVGAVPYNATTPNGMGRIVLKKTDNFKTVVEAQTNGNTIFVIKYDYTLTDNMIVPANCVLEFEGGSISGTYTITGQNTGIQAGLVKIFNTDVILAGSWNVAEAYPEWFGAKGDGVTDDNTYLQKTINTFDKICFIKNKIYGFTDIALPSDIELYGGGTLLYLETNLEQGQAYYPIHTDISDGSNNIKIHDLTFDGNVLNAEKGDDTYLVCDTLTLIGNNINVYNCKFINNVDSGIMFSECKNSQIHHCYFDIATDSGIYVNANGKNNDDTDDNNVTGMYLFSIHDNIFKHTANAAVALKRISSRGLVNNNLISYCGAGVTLEHGTQGLTDYSQQIDICNNYIKNTGLGILVRGGYNHNVVANRLENQTSIGILINSAKNVNCCNNIIYRDDDISQTDDAIRISYHNPDFHVENINIVSNNIKTTLIGIQIYSNYSGESYKNINISNNIIDTPDKAIQLASGKVYENINIIGNIGTKLSIPIYSSEILVKDNTFITIIGGNVYLVNKYLSYGNFVRKEYITNEKSSTNNIDFKKFDTVLLSNSSIGERRYIANADGKGSNVLVILDGYVYRNPNYVRDFKGGVMYTGTDQYRPTNVPVGYQYFDQTLGKPIYWNGSAWVDATGTTV